MQKKGKIISKENSSKRVFQYTDFNLMKAILLCVIHCTLSKVIYSADVLFFYWGHLYKLLQFLTNVCHIFTHMKVGKVTVFLNNQFHSSLL